MKGVTRAFGRALQAGCYPVALGRQPGQHAPMNRWLLVGAVNGLLAVAAGAFAAHGLEGRVAPRMLEIFQTAAQYHLIHALAIVGTSLIRGPGAKRAAIAAWLFTGGIVLFSGSLYFLVLANSTALVLATPLGGVSLLAAWAALAFAALKYE
jgi:uncharacterized membrane protein YgdD (TMEM256/DUF423 family)